MLAAVWFHDQIQVFGYLCALAALATVYHRIQRRYYDLQSFFRQTRSSVLNALDSCTTVGELSMVRDNARAGFATSVPLDYDFDSRGIARRRPLSLAVPAIVLVFFALLLLGAIKTHAGLGLPGLTQDNETRTGDINLSLFRRLGGIGSFETR